MKNVDDKNTADTDGHTPFYIAAEKGHFEICNHIMKNVIQEDIVQQLQQTQEQHNYVKL